DGIRDFHVTGVQTCALPIFDAGVRVLLHSWVVDTIAEPGTSADGGIAVDDGSGVVRGVIFESKQGRRAILARVVVDTTGDLDVRSEERRVGNESGARVRRKQ